MVCPLGFIGSLVEVAFVGLANLLKYFGICFTYYKMATLLLLCKRQSAKHRLVVSIAGVMKNCNASKTVTVHLEVYTITSINS